MDQAVDPPGIDVARVGAVVNEHRPGLLGQALSATLVEGGRSNLTYIVTDGHARVVVRRPPLGHVLETAHDMSREVRFLTGLANSAVPVPEVLLDVPDADVIGAPFYVMAFVPGRPYRWASELEALGHERTAAITHAMVRTLADLHAVDPADVGLLDVGRPEGFVERQVRRWRRQLDASRRRDVPGIDELGERLGANLPPEQRPAIVHGDYRLDNLLVDDDDRIRAVVDWEMATSGDPITDLGLLIAYLRLSALLPILGDAPRAAGFLSEEEILEAYVEVGGRDLTDIGYYIALGSFKAAVILEGIHTRFSQGQTVGGGFDLIGDAVEPIVATGLAALAARPV